MNVFELFAKISLDTSGYEKGLKDSESKMKSVGSAIGGGLKTAAKVGTVAIGAVATATTAMTAKVVKSTGEVAEYGDNIDKMSQKMGLTAEAYQEWEAVMQHSGTSMSAMKASMKTLANAAQSNSEAFKQLGISQEEIANMSQEELFEATITALQNVENTTERTYLAGKTLGRGATELGALLNTSAEDTQKMRDRVHELGGVMSNDAVKAAAAYQDSLQDMTTAIDGAKRGFLSELMPAITTVMDGLSDLFSGNGGIELITKGIGDLVQNISSKIPNAIKAGQQIMESLSQVFLDNLPTLADFGVDIVLNMADRILNSAPQLVTVAFQIIQSLISGIMAKLPELLDTAIQILDTIVSGITSNIGSLATSAVLIISQLAQMLIARIPELVQVALELITGLADGLLKALPELVKQIPIIINALVNALLESIPMIIDAGVELLTSLVEDLPAIIDSLIEAIPLIITNLIDALVKNAPKLAEAGFKLFTALVSNMPKITITILKAIPKLLTSIVTALLNGVPKLISTGKQLLGSMFKKLPEILGKAKDGMKNIMNTIIDVITDNPLTEAGKNLIKGLWNGIASMKDWLFDLVASFGKGLINKVKNVFKIKSPSRVFAEIGKFLALGLGDGWEDTFPNVQNGIEDDLAFDVGQAVSDIEASVRTTGTDGELYTLSDVYSMMNRILESIETSGMNTVSAIENTDTSIVLNDREFGRAVRKAYA